jgi:hypothetical protein
MQQARRLSSLWGIAERPDGRITLADMAAAYEKHSGRLTIQQHSKKEVKLELEFLAVVTFPGTGPGDFWARAVFLAWATDLVHQFCLQAWPKGVEVVARRGRFVSDAAASEEVLSGSDGP